MPAPLPSRGFADGLPGDEDLVGGPAPAAGYRRLPLDRRAGGDDPELGPHRLARSVEPPREDVAGAWPELVRSQATWKPPPGRETTTGFRWDPG